MKIIKQELQIEECLKQKLEFICEGFNITFRIDLFYLIGKIADFDY